MILRFGACAAILSVLAPALAYEDKQHFSRVFQAERSYRIFLPEDYEHSNKRYPVIYVFHGNGGSHLADPYARPDEGNTWKDEIDVSVFFQVPEFTAVVVDNGVQNGKGNGNGIPEPGESIVLEVEGRPTRLYYEDAWIEKDDEVLRDELLPSKWKDGFTFTSAVHIDAQCPTGHAVGFLANYETKDFDSLKRTVHWGTIQMVVGAATRRSTKLEAEVIRREDERACKTERQGSSGDRSRSRNRASHCP